jgi:hypothetical protein
VALLLVLRLHHSVPELVDALERLKKDLSEDEVLECWHSFMFCDRN